MILCVPPKDTAGLGLAAVRGNRRSPAPPARMKTGVVPGCLIMSPAQLRSSRSQLTEMNRRLGVHCFYSQRFNLSVCRLQHKGRWPVEDMFDDFVVQVNDDVNSWVLLI